MQPVFKKFVKLVTGNLTVNGRIYPSGSVVEVLDLKAADLVKHKHAEPHPGPAFEPSETPPATPPATPIKAKK